MNVQGAYEEWSATYDADPNATRDLDGEVLARVLSPLRFASVIEAGCGTGKNTAFLSQHGTRVLALDFSPGMLAKAQARPGRRPNVTFVVADLTRSWPCRERVADLVTCNLVLEHVRELRPVFEEAARSLKDGGQLFVSELHPFRQYAGTVASYRRNDQTIRVPAFVHHISDFLETAHGCGFRLDCLREWWHKKDAGKPPRLVSFLFELGG